jgi:hypothetical protein
MHRFGGLFHSWGRWSLGESKTWSAGEPEPGSVVRPVRRGQTLGDPLPWIGVKLKGKNPPTRRSC